MNWNNNTMLDHGIYVACIVIGLFCITYKSYAERQNWKIGKILFKDSNVFSATSVILLVYVLFKSLMGYSWWSPIIIFIMGFIISSFTIGMFREKSQIIAICGLPIVIIILSAQIVMN